MLKVLRDEINEAVTRYLENRLQTNSLTMSSRA
jgi:hypothetical protein